MAVGLSWAECTDPRMSECVCCKCCWLNWLKLIDTCQLFEISHWFLYLLPQPELNLHWPTDVGLSVASVGISLKIEQRVLLGWRSCQKSVIEVVGLSKAAKAHWPAVLYCVVRVIFLNHFRAVEDWRQYCFLVQIFQSSCPSVQSGLKLLLHLIISSYEE